MEKKRNYGLDFLRGILCIMVFIGHYYFPELSDNKIEVIRAFSGGNAVTGWFVLSGFTTIYYSKQETSAPLLTSCLNKYKRQFKKIYPVYLISTLFSLAALPVDFVNLTGGV